ncbi:hypothetical protein BLAT2472_10703 [Burkholderia latens]
MVEPGTRDDPLCGRAHRRTRCAGRRRRPQLRDRAFLRPAARGRTRESDHDARSFTTDDRDDRCGARGARRTLLGRVSAETKAAAGRAAARPRMQPRAQ